MIYQPLYIGRWKVKFYFAIDSYDIDVILDSLYDIDATDDILYRAYQIMKANEYNRGFTYSNPEMRMSVVVIGPTSSGRQFQNTFVHEIRHMADAIAKSLWRELDAEEPAYLSGDAAMSLAHILCKFGCDKCNH